MQEEEIKMISSFQMKARRVEQGRRCCVVLFDSDGCPHVRVVIFLSSAVIVHFESEAEFKTSAASRLGDGSEYSVVLEFRKKHHERMGIHPPHPDVTKPGFI